MFTQKKSLFVSLVDDVIQTGRKGLHTMQSPFEQGLFSSSFNSPPSVDDVSQYERDEQTYHKHDVQGELA